MKTIEDGFQEWVRLVVADQPLPVGQLEFFRGIYFGGASRALEIVAEMKKAEMAAWMELVTETRQFMQIAVQRPEKG